MKCALCLKPVAKAGFTYSGKKKVQQWMCNNKDCGNFRSRKVESKFVK
jgi:hypothetical protein